MRERPRHISENDTAWKERVPVRDGRFRGIFGEKFVDSFLMADSSPGSSENFKEIDDFFQEAERQLKESLRKGHGSAWYFFNELLDADAPFQAELKRILGIEVLPAGKRLTERDPAEKKYILALARAFNSNQIPLEVFIEMMIWHVKKVRALRNRVEDITKRYREELRAALYKAIENGLLPLEKMVVDRRLEETEVLAADISVHRNMSVARYEPEWQLLILTSEVIDLKKTYTHEMMHGMSGRTILSRGEASENQAGTLRIQRVGLIFTYPSRKGREGGGVEAIDYPLFWLNEAVTEEITLDLLGMDDSPSYQRERALLKELYARGLSKQLLYAAYFENRKVEAESGRQLPAWRALVDHCNQVFRDQGGIRYLYNLCPTQGER